MRFLSTSLPGVAILEPERHQDERGYIARTWCARQLTEHGLDPKLSQVREFTPRFHLNVGSLTRTPYGESPEYHTSGEDPSLGEAGEAGRHFPALQVSRAAHALEGAGLLAPESLERGPKGTS